MEAVNCSAQPPGAVAATSSTLSIVTATLLVTLTTMYVLRRTFTLVRQPVEPSPLRTVIPRLSKDELERLEYRPDELPGARDVMTPVSRPTLTRPTVDRVIRRTLTLAAVRLDASL